MCFLKFNLILNNIYNLLGMGTTPYIMEAMAVDPSIIITALTGCMGMFACFTIASLVAKRRDLIYIYGMFVNVLK